MRTNAPETRVFIAKTFEGLSDTVEAIGFMLDRAEASLPVRVTIVIEPLPDSTSTEPASWEAK